LGRFWGVIREEGKEGRKNWEGTTSWENVAWTEVPIEDEKFTNLQDFCQENRLVDSCNLTPKKQTGKNTDDAGTR